MAALRPCPSAGHVVAVGARRPCMISNPSSSLRVVRALGRQRQASTSLAGHGFGLAGRVASSPRPRHRHGIAVQRGDPDWPLEPCGKGLNDEQFKTFAEELEKHYCELDNKDMSFRGEIETICEHWKKIASWNDCIFEMEATALSLHLCMVATKAVKLASRIMDNATLRLDKQDETSLHTTKQTLTMYVSILVKLAEDTYNRKFDDDSVFSLVGAFRGVAAIGHILVKDALESVDSVEYGSCNYNFLVQDTDNSWHGFEQNMDSLEDTFRAALKNSSKMYKLLRPTMEKAIAFTTLFVSQMLTRHEKMICYIPGTTKGRRAARASTEEESDGSKTHESSGSN